ncbi:MAG: (Fe-S)-binding protein [Promethearchaeota archaeon]
MEEKILVRNFEIKEILPCLTTPGYIRFVAQADNRLDDVIPIIFIQTPPGKANYIQKDNTLTLRMFNRNVTLFASGKIGVTNTPDVNAAKDFLYNTLKPLINNAYKDFLKHGPPSKDQIKAIKKSSWMELYKYLPGENCGECGYPICSSFAVAVFQGDAKLSQCKLLREPKYNSKLQNLIDKFGRMFLASLGLDLINES